MTPEELDAARLMLVGGAGEEPAEDLLYANWYHKSDAGPRRYPAGGAYLAAILDPGRFEAGWQVAQTGLPGQAGCVEVHRNGERRAVAPPLVVPEAQDALVFEPGASVCVFPLGAAESGGFWHVTSPAWEMQEAPEHRQRLYFGLAPGSEPAFARAFVDCADLKAAWSMKCLVGASSAGRCDGAVAYLPAELGLDTGWVADLIAAAAPLVAGASPPGTRVIAEGIAWAPDPETDRSFGQVICAALADVRVDPSDAEAWTVAARSALAPLLKATP
ncbi:MAG: T3SS effector HopA1 family protein [Rhodobacter sp.]|nr:T3SS effector HopA1 family protein [Rhodobacter sp.]